MEEAPPPADHVIRPHHIALLTILMVGFRDLAIKDFPSPYALHLHRVLLNEISEVAQPKSHAELMSDISSGPQSDSPDCHEFQMAISTIHHDLNTVDKMGNFLGSSCVYVLLDVADILLKICVVFSKILKIRTSPQYLVVQADMLIFKTLADKKNWATPNLYDVWEKNLMIGDENLAIENLRCFFEQHFHESNDSGFRPHALLNLVRLHYMNGEFLAARQLLGEAIDTARLSNDRITLHHCTSILHRLPPLDEAQKPILQEVQPDLHPFEILFDVSKLLDPVTEQPLSASFIKIFQAIGLYDHWLDVQCAVPVEEQQWAQHAVQSIVWREAGCNKLADIEQNIVLAFTAPGGENSNRMSIALNKSYQTARQGNYTAALALLIDPSVWRGLIIQDYGTWAHAIWDILALRATRRFNLYRTAIIILADIGLEFGMTKRSRQILEEIMPQVSTNSFIWFDADSQLCSKVINGDDLEQRAVACFTLARCIIVAEGSSSNALHQALPYLSKAEFDFKALEMYQPLKDVQYMLSVIYHNLDMAVERQAAAERHSETETIQKKLEMVVSDPEISEIFDLMEIVGSALTSR
ncbi:hypothetical protein CVT25_015634 [Psilocybe cyanescens]|uniref:Anaphase-promoting complex subunit 5 n=1 Tax=Psilocybe cyanescens TaxID=93625 RepID=A0A409WI37_PSICY|nr:hypothetical protein CVT25_015634 [Psilocybe cyanescens]